MTLIVPQVFTFINAFMSSIKSFYQYERHKSRQILDLYWKNDSILCELQLVLMYCFGAPETKMRVLFSASLTGAADAERTSGEAL